MLATEADRGRDASRSCGEDTAKALGAAKRPGDPIRKTRRRAEVKQAGCDEEKTYRAAVVSRALTMLHSSVVLLSCCRKDGLWNATQAGSVLEMTRSHSAMSSGVSL